MVPDRESPILVGACPATGEADRGSRMHVFCRQALHPQRFTLDDFHKTFWRVNVAKRFVHTLRGANLPAGRIAELETLFRDDRVMSVIFLGRHVSEAFDLRGSYFQACVGPGYPFIVFPDPIASHQFWAAKGNRERARKWLFGVIERQRCEHEARDLRAEHRASG